MIIKMPSNVLVLQDLYTPYFFQITIKALLRKRVKWLQVSSPVFSFILNSNKIYLISFYSHKFLSVAFERACCKRNYMFTTSFLTQNKVEFEIAN